MRFNEFLAEFEPITLIFGNNSVSDEVIDVYFAILKDYDLKYFKRAVVEILKTYKYNIMPKPAEFIEIIKSEIQNDKNEAKMLQIKFEANFIGKTIKDKNGNLWIIQQISKDENERVTVILQSYKDFEKTKKCLFNSHYELTNLISQYENQKKQISSDRTSGEKQAKVIAMIKQITDKKRI